MGLDVIIPSIHYAIQRTTERASKVKTTTSLSFDRSGPLYHCHQVTRYKLVCGAENEELLEMKQGESVKGLLCCYCLTLPTAISTCSSLESIEVFWKTEMEEVTEIHFKLLFCRQREYSYRF
jgi:hypothetical protein